MKFLSNGDFGFPFTFPLFFMQQFYMWSYQTGASNPDGIIRMPGRLIEVLVFALFGNLAMEYFYIFSSLAIVFWAFYYFSSSFLRIKSRATCLLGALLFTLNPITLGNLSKIGLVLAAAMLPLSLTVVRQVFIRRQLRYFVYWILFINISLIHPFTFTVNLVISGCYFLYLTSKNRSFVRQKLPKIVAIGVVAVLLYMYFILPLAGMRTLSKSALTNTVTGAPTNYAALVDTLNTGNIFTGISLSKNLLLDFNFYNSTYESFYFLGVFAFYVLLFLLYMRVEKELTISDKRRMVSLLAAFLVLVVLATVTFLHVDVLIRLLIKLPAGWEFRSPLKWQLYIPFAIFGLFVLLMKYVQDKRTRKLFYAGILASFLLMNGYLFGSIYAKLLTPRHIEHFAALQRTDLNQQNMLFVSGSDCFTFESNNPTVMTEFNQVVISKNVQLKQVDETAISTINLSSYSYIVNCEDSVEPQLIRDYGFHQADAFASGALTLYRNTNAAPYVSAANSLYTTTPTQLNDKYSFVTNLLRQKFNFVDSTAGKETPPLVHLQGMFDNLSFADIRSGIISTTVQPGHSQQLYIRKQPNPLYYLNNNGAVLFSPDKVPGSNPAPSTLQLASGKTTIGYADPSYHYQNLVPNPSLDQGLWQKKVGDCYDYDNFPGLGMSLNTKDKSMGRQSLQLTSSNHIACTGPNSISVQSGQQYLLSFAYQTPDGNAGYSVGYGQNGTAASEMLTQSGSRWHTLNRVITVPDGVTSLRLMVNAYPDGVTGGTGVARYDDFKLSEIPSIQNVFYAVSGSLQSAQVPTTRYRVINPTKTQIHITNATAPFYLVTKESYSAEWQLEVGGGATLPFDHPTIVPAADHLEINGSMNGWYIDPAVFCRQTNACTKNAGGSYSMFLTMNFAPQSWFYVGVTISGITFLGVVYYIGRRWQREYAKKGRYTWHR